MGAAFERLGHLELDTKRLEVSEVVSDVIERIRPEAAARTLIS